MNALTNLFFVTTFIRARTVIIASAVLLSVLYASGAAASGDAGAVASHGPIQTLLWMAFILLCALLGRLVEKIGQPSVLGELLMGVAIGNLGLLGIHTFDAIRSDVFIEFLAQIGVIILLFQVGLESNLTSMRKVGGRAFWVAAVGVAVPFFLGTWVVGPWLLPLESLNAHLFLGAALTATSVGITARVFKDLGKLHLPEAQIVLGAAVIDDVLGLIILAVVSALVTLGSVSAGTIAVIVFKALAFLVGSIVIGTYTAPHIGRLFSSIHTGAGAKLTLAIVFALFYSALAGLIGLAPIIGAFSAGLILDPVHFRSFKKPKPAEELEEYAAHLNGDARQHMEEAAAHYTEKHIEDLLQPIGYFIVPIFFVFTGIGVRLETLFSPTILGIALAVTLVAFVGKYASSLVAGKGLNKKVIGFGMAPRGEVGLIFASMGMSLGVLSESLFSIIVIMVILTTLITPPILAYYLKK